MLDKLEPESENFPTQPPAPLPTGRERPDHHHTPHDALHSEYKHSA
jgi:hypothetical protein